MQMFEDDHTHFDPRNPYIGDEKLPVQFRMDGYKNDGKSETEGRPIYEDTEFIRILVSKDHIIDRPVRDSDKRRWPRQYAAWKNTGANEPGMMGTPLKEWSQISPATVEELRYFKIFTIEQLAEISDGNAQKVNGIQKLKQMAAMHILLTKEEAPIQHMNNELAKRDAEIETLKQQVNELLTRQAQSDTIKPQPTRR